jgi:hypothetical protein
MLGFLRGPIFSVKGFSFVAHAKCLLGYWSSFVVCDVACTCSFFCFGYIVSIVWSFACALTDRVCFLAVSFLLSFGQVESRIVSLPLNFSAVVTH